MGSGFSLHGEWFFLLFFFFFWLFYVYFSATIVLRTCFPVLSRVATLRRPGGSTTRHHPRHRGIFFHSLILFLLSAGLHIHSQSIMGGRILLAYTCGWNWGDRYEISHTHEWLTHNDLQRMRQTQSRSSDDAGEGCCLLERNSSRQETLRLMTCEMIRLR